MKPGYGYAKPAVGGDQVGNPRAGTGVDLGGTYPPLDWETAWVKVSRDQQKAVVPRSGMELF